MKAVQITAPGPADAMKLVDVAVPAIGDDQVLVRVAYAGINYIDTYQRGGLYPVPLPFVMGREASGVVETVGAKVESLKQGDRVAFMTGGCYAEFVAIKVSDVVSVPKDMTLRDAGAAMLQGLTAHYLVTSTYKIQKGDSILVHAGAGGTGALVIQMAKLNNSNSNNMNNNNNNNNE